MKHCPYPDAEAFEATMLARERKSPSAKKIRPGFANVEEAQKGHRDHCDDCPELFAPAVRHAAFAPFFSSCLATSRPIDNLKADRKNATDHIPREIQTQADASDSQGIAHALVGSCHGTVGHEMTDRACSRPCREPPTAVRKVCRHSSCDIHLFRRERILVKRTILEMRDQILESGRYGAPKLQKTHTMRCYTRHIILTRARRELDPGRAFMFVTAGNGVLPCGHFRHAEKLDFGEGVRFVLEQVRNLGRGAGLPRRE